MYLLNNHVKLKWVIKTGKQKDDPDFSALSQQVKPGLLLNTVTRNFKAGPFVIAATDLLGVDALIDNYYAENNLTGNDRPRVFQTSLAVTVDVRYDLNQFVPRAAVLTDGGNQSIHLAYMAAAGIPSANYTTSTGSDLQTGCYTFASEPHNDHVGASVDYAVSAIRNFVFAGGNFLAQCAAVANYELRSAGRFQTTAGVQVTNTSVGTSIAFPNPDLSYSQFEGLYNASISGVVQNWKIIGSSSNNEHNHATGMGADNSVIGASVSKVKAGPGG
ncbi:MAG TPA: hypothetical protein VGC95_11280, partial [Chitinophagaceae bacterium]